MPAATFLSWIPRDSLPNLNVRPCRSPLEGITTGHEPDEGREICPCVCDARGFVRRSTRWADGGGVGNGRVEHLVTTTFYGRDACPAFVIEPRIVRTKIGKRRKSGPAGTFGLLADRKHGIRNGPCSPLLSNCPEKRASPHPRAHPLDHRRSSTDSNTMKRRAVFCLSIARKAGHLF